MDGIIFDVQEFAVHDGPGIRVVVFLKGCPLRCAWCHNPEGLDFGCQPILSRTGKRTAGTRLDSAELAVILNSKANMLRTAGGVTFSGGEPLAQAAFVEEIITRLDGLHVVLETSGHAANDDFLKVIAKVQLVYFDLKLMDSAQHRRWTGSDNRMILANFESLEQTGVPYVVRVPLVPGVTDTEENLKAIAMHISGRPGLQQVELLPYNRAAGGKYRACGRVYDPGFDEDCPVNADISLFEEFNVEVTIV